VEETVKKHVCERGVVLLPIQKVQKSAKYSEDQPRDGSGRFGSGGGSSPTAGSRGGAMGYRATTAIEASGGKVTTYPAGKDSSGRLAAHEESVGAAFADITVASEERDLTQEEVRAGEGLEHMGAALQEARNDADITVVTDSDGNLAGVAASTVFPAELTGNDYDTVELSVLGTNGLVPGAGSALISRLLGDAFENGQGFQIGAAEQQAFDFYRRIGLGEPSGQRGTNATFSMTPDQVGDWIASYVEEEMQ